MFGSSILEIAIGLVFVYLILSPAQGLTGGGGVPINPDVLVARPIVVVGAIDEAVEGQQLDFLPRHVGEDVDSHALIK